MRHHHHCHHHYRRHCRHNRYSNPLYWLTGAGIIEVALWAVALELIALWWILWLAARGAMIATRAMWQVTQPADGPEPRWQQALDAARPSWPKRQSARRII